MNLYVWNQGQMVENYILGRFFRNSLPDIRFYNYWNLLNFQVFKTFKFSSFYLTAKLLLCAYLYGSETKVFTFIVNYAHNNLTPIKDPFKCNDLWTTIQIYSSFPSISMVDDKQLIEKKTNRNIFVLYDPDPIKMSWHLRNQ